MRTIGTGLLLAALGAVLGCSQSSAPPLPSATSGVTNVAVAPASAAPAPAPAMTEEPFVVQTEKFGDGQKAFTSAKDALLTKYYAAGLTEEDVYRAAVRGMVEDIDGRMHRWNKLLSPTELGQIQAELSGEIVGIGVSIRFDDATGHIDILATTKGSPADQAGLLPHDTIVSVNGHLFRGKTDRDAIHELRGKAGDPVQLNVLRGDKLLPFTIVRAKVALHEVQHFVVDGVGELSIGAFTARTVPAMRAALEDFSAAHVRAIALDLRGNHGGSFDDAVQAANPVLPGRRADREARAARREGRDAHLEGEPGAPVDADRDPREPGHVIERRAPRGSALGEPARPRRRDAHVRQVDGAEHRRARERLRDQVHDGAVPHAERQIVRGGRARSGRRGRRGPRADRAGELPHGSGRAAGGGRTAPDGAFAAEAVTGTTEDDGRGTGRRRAMKCTNEGGDQDVSGRKRHRIASAVAPLLMTIFFMGSCGGGRSGFVHRAQGREGAR